MWLHGTGLLGETLAPLAGSVGGDGQRWLKLKMKKKKTEEGRSFGVILPAARGYLSFHQQRRNLVYELTVNTVSHLTHLLLPGLPTRINCLLL